MHDDFQFLPLQRRPRVENETFSRRKRTLTTFLFTRQTEIVHRRRYREFRRTHRVDFNCTFAGRLSRGCVQSKYFAYSGARARRTIVINIYIFQAGRSLSTPTPPRTRIMHVHAVSFPTFVPQRLC